MRGLGPWTDWERSDTWASGSRWLLAIACLSPAFFLFWIGQAQGPQPVRHLLVRTATPRNTARATAAAAGIYVMDLDGQRPRRIVGPEQFGEARYPSWSPDGKEIAFTAFDNRGRNPEIWIVPAEGGEARKVGIGVAPSWSRDGTRLVCMTSGKAEIATDWSRIGNNDERMVVFAVQGGQAGEPESIGQGLWPKWAPNDDRIAFVARPRNSWDVFVRSADRFDLIRLTDDPSLDTFPVWRPDGGAILYLSNRGGRWDLFESSARGGNEPKRLTTHLSREETASLSPDGTRIAFADLLGRRTGRILILEPEGDDLTELATGSMDARDPCWSPDGRKIAFSSLQTGSRR